MICKLIISNHTNTQQVYPDLFSVSGGLVQRLQPHVTQSQHGVGVVLSGRLLQNTLKLLLTRSPFLFGQVKVPYQGPGIWVILRFKKNKKKTSQLNHFVEHWYSSQTRVGDKEPD